MANILANGIRIEYDTFGRSSQRPLILIMGLGTQMIFWHEEFCQMLADQGHFVIRFDNRDVGLSSKIEQAGLPHVLKAMQAVMKGEKVTPPYTLEDMADDTAGLMDALGLESAHICGASMGGMIAQTMALRHPRRVRSLISIMSSTGNPELPQARPEIMKVLLMPPPVDREANIAYTVQVWRTIGSPGFPFDEPRVREMSAQAYDRCFHPAGTARQLMAIITQTNRKPLLKSVKIPTLVIHGSADPLVPVEAGKDTAEAIPGAKLLLIEGMGHDLPVPAWPRIVKAISEHTAMA